MPGPRSTSARRIRLRNTQYVTLIQQHDRVKISATIVITLSV